MFRRPTASPRARSRRLRALAVVLYALGLLVATAHFGLVEHRVCEHGEVAHEGDAHHGESGRADLEHADLEHAALGRNDGDAAAPQADPLRAPGEHDEPSHEHCELDQGTLVAPPFELAPPSFAEWLVEHFARPAAHAPRPPVIAILRLAPGRSPPRA
jgi:hypothetical protein